MAQDPYAYEIVARVRRRYNPDFGRDKICVCGHTYWRHFNMHAATKTGNADVEDSGCNNCECVDFVERCDD